MRSSVSTNLGHEETGRVGGAEHVDEEIIGEHVQLLHLLALHVGVPGGPEQVGDARPPHGGGHGLAGGLDAGQQLGQVAWHGHTFESQGPTVVQVIPVESLKVLQTKPVLKLLT